MTMLSIVFEIDVMSMYDLGTNVSNIMGIYIYVGKCCLKKFGYI